MRCDVNVSVRQRGSTTLGQRCEIKNINSMRYARRAIDYEMRRQIDLVEDGGVVEQQTLNFDPATGVTSPLRDKEEAHDYRYFPEPDLPPVVLSEAYVEAVRRALPALPWELYERFQEEFALPAYDAELLTEERQTAGFFLELTRYSSNFKGIANLIINKVMPHCKEGNIEISDFPVPPQRLAAFIQLIDEGMVSSAKAYQFVFPELVEQPQSEPLELAKALNLIQTSDENYLEELVKEVLDQHPEKVKTYRNGKKGLLGFFMGEVMKKSRGKADPKVTNQLLREKLAGE